MICWGLSWGHFTHRVKVSRNKEKEGERLIVNQIVTPLQHRETFPEFKISEKVEEIKVLSFEKRFKKKKKSPSHLDWQFVSDIVLVS